jgi:DNA-binding CsgD family transcriptional regulator
MGRKLEGRDGGMALNRPRTGWDSLTETERRVVDLVAEGLTNPQIARRMFISAQTVKTHMKNVFRKLDVSTRSELAAQHVRNTRP